MGKYNNKPKCKNNLDYNFDDSETVGLGSISRAVFACNPPKKILIIHSGIGLLAGSKGGGKSCRWFRARSGECV